jgi:hypothetical protein
MRSHVDRFILWVSAPARRIPSPLVFICVHPRLDAVSRLTNLQADLYRTIKSDPVLKNYPVGSLNENGAEADKVGRQFLTIPGGSDKVTANHPGEQALLRLCVPLPLRARPSAANRNASRNGRHGRKGRGGLSFASHGHPLRLASPHSHSCLAAFAMGILGLLLCGLG